MSCREGGIGIEWTSQQMAWAYGRGGVVHYGLNRGEHFTEEM